VVALAVGGVLDRREYRVDPGEQRRTADAETFQYVASGECVFPSVRPIK
jgi:hypothetical protein